MSWIHDFRFGGGAGEWTGDNATHDTDTSDPNTIHHVCIYIGNGEMVEAPHTGANVRISSAFRPDLIGAVRLYDR